VYHLLIVPFVSFKDIYLRRTKYYKN